MGRIEGGNSNVEEESSEGEAETGCSPEHTLSAGDIPGRAS